MTAQTCKVVDIAQWRKSTVPEMNEFQFQQWTALLAKRTGITLPDSRRSFLLSSLNIRMYELGIESYQAYYNYLHSGNAGNIEWQTLVDRLTVHETRFFRDQQALKLIREVYLEQLEEKPVADSINVWSVGCATGEESYSLAIELDRYLNDSGKRFYYAVTGSDISPAAIVAARKGIYKSARLSNVPQDILEHYLDKTAGDEFQVKPFLRQRVCFNQMNLLDLRNIKVGLMDIIFCQNVLIYFKREQRLQILDSLVAHLKQGGLLVLGAGEIRNWAHPDLEGVTFDSTLAFRRTRKQESEA